MKQNLYEEKKHVRSFQRYFPATLKKHTRFSNLKQTAKGSESPFAHCPL